MGRLLTFTTTPAPSGWMRCDKNFYSTVASIPNTPVSGFADGVRLELHA